LDLSGRNFAWRGRSWRGPARGAARLKPGAFHRHGRFGIAGLDGLHAGRPSIAYGVDRRRIDGKADLVELAVTVHNAKHVLARSKLQPGSFEADADLEL
jgi:hypothetical protein